MNGSLQLSLYCKVVLLCLAEIIVFREEKNPFYSQLININFVAVKKRWSFKGIVNIIDINRISANVDTLKADSQGVIVIANFFS